jgi:hypothetical protein
VAKRIGRRLVLGILVAALLAAAGWWGTRGTVGRSEGRPVDRDARSAAVPGPNPREVALAPRERAGPAVAAPPAAPRLVGRVVDASTRAPVAGALVLFLRADGGTASEARTDAEGSFGLDAVAAASHLLVEAEGYARVEILAARARVPPIEVALPRGGRVEGDVRDRGSPLVGARLVAIRRRPVARAGSPAFQEEVLPGRLVVGGEAESDATGRFSVGPLAPGTYALRVEVPGLPPWLETAGGAPWDPASGFAVRDGETASAGTIEVPAAGTLVLRVLDGTTDAVLDDVAFEASTDVDRRAFASPVRPAARTPDGGYVLRVHLDRKGRLRGTVLLARKPGYAPWRGSLMGQADGSLVVARLGKEVAIEGRVTKEGRAVPGAAVLVRRDVDEVVFAAVVADSDGAFSLAGLPAGEDLEVMPIDPATGSAISLAAVRLRTDVRHPPFALGDVDLVRGVVSVRGVPAAGALVAVDAPDGRRVRALSLGPDGAFGFRLDSLGLHEVYVGLPSEDGETDGSSVERAFDLPRGGVDVSVDLGWELRGVVRYEPPETPAPLEQARVEARRSPARVEPDRDWVASARAGPDGAFRLRLPGAGTWFVAVEPDVWTTPHAVRVEVPDADSPAAVSVPAVRDPADATIVLEVRDEETGEPLGDVDYDYASGNTRGGGSLPDDGVLHDAGRSLGEHRYRFEAPEHAPRSVVVEVTREAREVRRTVALRRSNAVRVLRVDAESNAERAGLRAGDLLLAHGERAIRAFADLRAATAATAGLAEVRVRGLRDGQPTEWSVRGGRLGVEVENADARAR